jgi:hypothetical protein
MYEPTDWTATICTFDGCTKPRTGVFHTMCRYHNEKARLQKNAELAPLGFGKGCSVTDCQRPHHATGLCRLHYNRKSTTGSTELRPKAPKVKAPLDECEAKGCTALRKSPGVDYCSRHDTNMRRHGVLEVGTRRGGELLERFARRLVADDEIGCWLWREP